MPHTPDTPSFMGDALQRWIAELSSSEPAKVAAAAEALANRGCEARPAAVALVSACRTSDPTAHAWCAAALEELGPPLPDQIDSLIELARDPALDVAYWAVTLLGRAGKAAAPATATLIDVLRHSQELPVRERAAWALGKLGPAAGVAVPALHEAAAGDQPRLSRLAKNALAAITG